MNNSTTQLVSETRNHPQYAVGCICFSLPVAGERGIRGTRQRVARIPLRTS